MYENYYYEQLVQIVTCLKYLIDAKYQDTFYRFVSGTWIPVIIMVILLMFCVARFLFPTVSCDVSASFLRCFYGFLGYFICFPSMFLLFPILDFAYHPLLFLKTFHVPCWSSCQISWGEHPDKWAVTEIRSYHSFKKNFFLFWV